MYRREAVVVSASALAGCGDRLAALGEPPVPNARKSEKLIHEGITEERAAVGLPPLSARELLVKAARRHCEDMAARDFYAHENPDGEGPSARAGCPAGENIHRGPLGDVRNEGGDRTWYIEDATALAGYVVEGWVLSDGHYELMTSPRWSAIGVGVAVDTEANEFFATAVFC